MPENPTVSVAGEKRFNPVVRSISVWQSIIRFVRTFKWSKPKQLRKMARSVSPLAFEERHCFVCGYTVAVETGFTRFRHSKKEWIHGSCLMELQKRCKSENWECDQKHE